MVHFLVLQLNAEAGVVEHDLFSVSTEIMNIPRLVRVIYC